MESGKEAIVQSVRPLYETCGIQVVSGMMFPKHCDFWSEMLGLVFAPRLMGP